MRILIRLAMLLTLFPARAGAIEPEKFLPPDTVFVGMVRPRQVMTSALAKSQGWDDLLKAKVATNGQAQEFLENVGLNPFTQIDSVLIASTVFPLLVNPTPEESTSFKPSYLVTFRGNFQSKRLIKALESLGKENGAPVKRIKVDDLILWELPVPGAPVYVGIHNQQKAVFLANRKEDVISCIRNGFGELKSKDLAAALTSLSGKESAWLAGTVTGKVRANLALNPEFQAVADQMEAWAIGADLSDIVRLGLNLVARKGKPPEALKDALEKKLLPDLREKIAKTLESRAKYPEKADLGDRTLKAYQESLKSIQLTTSGRVIGLKFDLTGALLDSIQGKEEKKP